MLVGVLGMYAAWLDRRRGGVRSGEARLGEGELQDDPMDIDLTPRQEVEEICREEIRKAQEAGKPPKPCLKTSQEKYEVGYLPEVIDHPVLGRVGSRQVSFNRNGSNQVWENVWDPMEEEAGPCEHRFAGVVSDPKPSPVPSSGWAAKMEGRSPACVDTLGTTTFADVVGWNKFRGERQLEKAAAFSVAHYRSIDPIDGDDVDVRAKVGFGESLKQGISKLGGRIKKHNAKHRASNRFHRRVIVVKSLVNAVKFEAPGIFTASEADKRALHLIVRRVVKDALEKGVELPGGMVTIRNQEKAWYLDAVRTSYYIHEEDDEFWARLAEHGSAITH